MNKENFLKEIHKELLKAADIYYNSEEKYMSDEKFDELKSYWEENSGKKFQVGATPNVSNTTSLSHSYDDLAGTLDKVTTINELRKWLKKRKIEVNEENPLAVSLKYDGHSINFEFTKNRLRKALTRGKDLTGKNLTGYFLKAWNSVFKKDFYVPKIKNYSIDSFAVGFEAVISWSNLELLNKEFSTTYKNPRSAISGIIKENGLPLAKYLTLIPLKYRAQTSQQVTRMDELNALSFMRTENKIANFDEMDFEVFHSIEELEQFYDLISKERFKIPYMIDGIVVETMNQDLRDELGYTDQRPNFSVAFKLPYMEQETKILDVEWYSDGNSATYTPVAVIEPVKLNGATYQKVSLANYRRFKSMALKKNDSVLFQLSNDVLGYVEKMSQHGNSSNEKFKAPTHCSSCGSKLHTNDVFLYCVNPECSLVKIGSLQQFLEKMDLKGIKRQTIKALYDAEIIHDIEDFLTLDKESELEISRLEGFGKESAKNICDTINNKLLSSKGIYDYELLGSLNIELISIDRAKLILKNMSLNGIRDYESLKKIDGIGDAVINSIKGNITLIFDTFTVFELNGVIIKSYYEELKKNQTSGKKYIVVVTGDLNNFSSRDEFKHIIELAGHKLSSSISKKTDYLITNDTTSGTVKNQKAVDLGVSIITEKEAITILGIGRNDKSKVDINEAFD